MYLMKLQVIVRDNEAGLFIHNKVCSVKVLIPCYNVKQRHS